MPATKLLLGAGFLLYLLAYLAGLNGSFQFDDFKVIVHNPDVASLSAWWQAMPGIRPLLKLSYAWQAGESASHFRLLNIFLHTLNSSLVGLLTYRALQEARPSGSQDMVLPAIAAALSFAVHPAMTEAVTYICGRSVSLMASAYLLALLCWQQATESGTRRPLLIAASLASFAIAMGVRESACTLPLAALWWSLLIRKHSWRVALAETWPLWIGMLIMLAALLAIGDYQRLLQHSWQIRSLGEQVLGQINAHAYLLTHSLVGWQINIDPDIRVPAELNATTILIGLVLVIGISLTWILRKRYPWLLLAVSWWLLHLLASNSAAARLDLANDRHIYLPVIGIVMALAIYWQNTAYKHMLSALWIGLFLFWTAQTTLRNQEYASEVSLWQATVKTSPEKARPWNNLGYAYQQAGNRQAAISAYQRALYLAPSDATAKLNLYYLE